jgi:hypothetical protein
LNYRAIRDYIKGYDKKVVIVRRVFTNKNGSIGILNLLCSDINLDGNEVSTSYEKRWRGAPLRVRVEEFHKSLKHNVDLPKSPTKTVRTQRNHMFLSVLAFF